MNEHIYANIQILYDEVNGNLEQAEKEYGRKLTNEEMEYWNIAIDNANIAKDRHIVFKVPSNGW